MISKIEKEIEELKKQGYSEYDEEITLLDWCIRLAQETENKLKEYFLSWEPDTKIGAIPVQTKIEKMFHGEEE